MRQDAFVERRSGKSGVDTVSVTGNTVDLGRASVICLEAPAGAVFSGEQILALPSSLSIVRSVSEATIRKFDVIVSVIMLLLAAPAIIFIALLIKLSSPGSVLYKQKRVGQAGKIFTLYKFRTMVNNAEKQTGPVLATKDDRRVTPLGRILRCTRLDELPQLFNVLRGDMSIVGPRPERPYFVSQHRALQGVRLAVKPGITGLAQIRAFYDLKPEHKLKYDFLYIQKRSLLLNLYILLQTIPVIFLKKGW